jgi:hypothetical protein
MRLTPKQAFVLARDIMAQPGRAVEVYSGEGRKVEVQFEGRAAYTIGPRGKSVSSLAE